MTGLLRLAARRVAVVVADLFPSVPRAQRARVLAAVECRHVEAPEGEGAPSLAAAAEVQSHTDPRPPAPDYVLLVAWHAHPVLSRHMTDDALGRLLDRWRAEAGL